MQNRRDFIRQSCAACAATIGLAALGIDLISCKSSVVITTDVVNNLLKVPLAKFGDQQTLIVRAASMDNDIMLVKKSPDNIIALLMKCTHRGYPLTATRNGFYCDSHGSQFDLNGDVTKEPAQASLKKFKTSLVKNIVVIDLKS